MSKVALCVPCKDIVQAGFSYDFTRLACNLAVSNHDLAIYQSQGTLIADQRVNLAKEAIAEGAEWLLWVDSDMRFPATAGVQLLAHNKPIVAANYVTRRIPVEPVAFNYANEIDAWRRVATYTTSTGLEQVDCVGMGLMLTHRDVFKNMPDPWFHLAYSTKNTKFHGEDVYFCMNAGKAGFPTLIDHDLSKQVGHIGIMEFRHEHAGLGVEAEQEAA